jgi:hypothetical protein
MDEINEPLRELANFAGFLFQIRVGHEIDSRFADSHLTFPRIKHREHKVMIPGTAEEVFIDFVLEYERSVYVVECKRVNKGRWLFLIPDEKKEVLKAQLPWSSHGNPNLVGRDEFALYPTTPEAAFCVTDRKEQNRDARLLEEIASNLVRATEAYAIENVSTTIGGMKSNRVYVPLLITNASLAVCYFDPSSVDLVSGELPLGAAAYESCSLVKFRKSLSSLSPSQPTGGKVKFVPGSVYDQYAEYVQDERSVLIMGVSGFVDAWPQLRVSSYDADGYPWDIARQEA